MHLCFKEYVSFNTRALLSYYWAWALNLLLFQEFIQERVFKVQSTIFPNGKCEYVCLCISGSRSQVFKSVIYYLENPDQLSDTKQIQQMTSTINHHKYIWIKITRKKYSHIFLYNWSKPCFMVSFSKLQQRGEEQLIDSFRFLNSHHG